LQSNHIIKKDEGKFTKRAQRTLMSKNKTKEGKGANVTNAESDKPDAPPLIQV